MRDLGWLSQSKFREAELLGTKQEKGGINIAAMATVIAPSAVLASNVARLSRASAKRPTAVLGVAAFAGTPVAFRRQASQSLR